MIQARLSDRVAVLFGQQVVPDGLHREPHFHPARVRLLLLNLHHEHPLLHIIRQAQVIQWVQHHGRSMGVSQGQSVLQAAFAKRSLPVLLINHGLDVLDAQLSWLLVQHVGHRIHGLQILRHAQSVNHKFLWRGRLHHGGAQLLCRGGRLAPRPLRHFPPTPHLCHGAGVGVATPRAAAAIAPARAGFRPECPETDGLGAVQLPRLRSQTSRQALHLPLPGGARLSTPRHAASHGLGVKFSHPQLELHHRRGQL
mmetsp:Transcript_34109/g.88527  ORF Transcript_34109/g.88527 Transcript_34109/m.88527 type:complete len:254 (+) Transcript_34109:681-1442(+)